jgi:hypothetical protein
MSLNIYQGTIGTHAANHRQSNDQKKRKRIKRHEMVNVTNTEAEQHHERY